MYSDWFGLSKFIFLSLSNIIFSTFFQFAINIYIYVYIYLKDKKFTFFRAAVTDNVFSMHIKIAVWLRAGVIGEFYAIN